MNCRSWARTITWFTTSGYPSPGLNTNRPTRPRKLSGCHDLPQRLGIFETQKDGFNSLYDIFVGVRSHQPRRGKMRRFAKVLPARQLRRSWLGFVDRLHHQNRAETLDPKLRGPLGNLFRQDLRNSVEITFALLRMASRTGVGETPSGLVTLVTSTARVVSGTLVVSTLKMPDVLEDRLQLAGVGRNLVLGQVETGQLGDFAPSSAEIRLMPLEGNCVDLRSAAAVREDWRRAGRWPGMDAIPSVHPGGVARNPRGCGSAQQGQGQEGDAALCRLGSMWSVTAISLGVAWCPSLFP